MVGGGWGGVVGGVGGGVVGGVGVAGWLAGGTACRGACVSLRPTFSLPNQSCLPPSPRVQALATQPGTAAAWGWQSWRAAACCCLSGCPRLCRWWWQHWSMMCGGDPAGECVCVCACARVRCVAQPAAPPFCSLPPNPAAPATCLHPHTIPPCLPSSLTRVQCGGPREGCSRVCVLGLCARLLAAHTGRHG